jgi:hypothetical protein
LGSQVQFPLTACTFVSYVCCFWYRKRPLRRADHSLRGILPGVCLIVCGLETSTSRRPRPELGCCVREKLVRSITRGVHHTIFCISFLLLLTSEPNTFSSPPCSRTLSAYVLPNVTDLGLHPYKTISRITRLYVVILTLMTRREHIP